MNTATCTFRLITSETYLGPGEYRYKLICEEHGEIERGTFDFLDAAQKRQKILESWDQHTRQFMACVG